MGDSGGGSEQSANSHVDYEGQAPEVSDENENSIGNCTTGHACYILAKNLSTFDSCPETLGESGFEEILKQLSI
jgi:hypothetical protein